MDTSEICRLAETTLCLENEKKPSIECYPHHLNLLYHLFSTLHTSFIKHNGKLPGEVLMQHIKSLKFAHQVLEFGLSHTEKMQQTSEFPATNLPEGRPPSYSIGQESSSISSTSTFCSSGSSNFSAAFDPSENVKKASHTLPHNASKKYSSVSRKATTLPPPPTDENALHTFAPLNYAQYEAFAPESPLHRITRKNRSIQDRAARLSKQPTKRRSDLSSTLLRLEREKAENLRLVDKEQKEYLARLAHQATDICSESVHLFRAYPKHFEATEFQLLYRQSALYNSFHLHENVLYQRLFEPRRVGARCVTHFLRDPRHPLVGFMRALPRRHLPDLQAAAELQDVAEKSNAVKAIGKAFATDLKHLSDIVTLIISHSSVKSRCTVVSEEEAEDLMPNFSRTIFSQTQEGRELYRLAIEQIDFIKAQDVQLLMQKAKLPPQELRDFTGVVTSLLAASPEEDEALFAEGARFIVQASSAFCPFVKLSLISQAITSLVDAASRAPGGLNAANLGADELSPLFAYGVLLWRQATLPVQCNFVDWFVPEEALLGLDGYALTSMIISVDFCVSNATKDSE